MRRKDNISKRGECLECGNQAFVYDNRTGETVCGHCGFVLSEGEVNRGPDWRAFTPKEIKDRTRVATRADMLTTLDPYGRDAFGRKISPEQRKKMLRLEKWQIRIGFQGSRKKNFMLAEDELNRLCDLLHIPPQAKELAWRIYRESFKKRLIRGRSIDAMVAAAIAVACRQLQIPRGLAAIAEKSRGDKKGVARSFRLILKKLEIRNPVPDLSIFIKKVGGNLGLSVETQEIAFQILREAQVKRATAGKDPRGLAAAALYIACLKNNERRTQKMIAEKAGVTEVTIRNRYTDLEKMLKEDDLDKSTLLTTEQITQDVEMPSEAET